MNRLAPFFAVLALLCILSAGCASLNGTGQIYQPVAAPGRTIHDAARQLINDLADGRAVWILANGSWVPVKCTIENNLIKLHRQDNGQVIIGLYSYRLIDRKIVLTSSMASVLEIGDLVKLRFSSVMGEASKRVADSLHVIQQDLENYRAILQKELHELETQANGTVAAERMPMSEEQRKLIVQANALTEQKKFSQARDWYRQALALDRTAYPAGYYNLALIEAQINKPFAAILYMKQYLLLEPNAKDARSAQDKIYEWEAMLENVARQ
jgi:tetratricopeptide (TPR) repeat protein